MKYTEGWTSCAPTLRKCVERAGTEEQKKAVKEMSDVELENRAFLPFNTFNAKYTARFKKLKGYGV